MWLVHEGIKPQGRNSSFKFILHILQLTFHICLLTSQFCHRSQIKINHILLIVSLNTFFFSCKIDFHSIFYIMFLLTPLLFSGTTLASISHIDLPSEGENHDSQTGGWCFNIQTTWCESTLPGPFSMKTTLDCVEMLDPVMSSSSPPSTEQLAGLKSSTWGSSWPERWAETQQFLMLTDYDLCLSEHEPTSCSVCSATIWF